MNDNMEFRLARREEAEEILKLYKSLIGMEYCAWTENYPTEQEVEFDLSRDALFCLREISIETGSNENQEMQAREASEPLVGVISIDDDPQVKALPCW